MAEETETFEEWRERTAPTHKAPRVIAVGSLIAGLLWATDLAGLGILWLFLIPALVVWNVIDFVRTRRHVTGGDAE